jgi:NAD(P)H-nitrite reductase large subunit
MARYLIIGNGVAGVRAAEMIRRRDGGGEITIIGDEAEGFYYRPQLADFAAGAQDEAGMRAKPPEFYSSNRINLILGRKATALRAAEHKVTLDDGSERKYDRLLIATGAAPQMPDLPGRDLQGVHFLHTMADARALAAGARGAKHAVVAGENVHGLELSRALRGLGVKVSHLVRGERFWPEMLDDDAAQLVEQHLEGHGATLLRNQQLKAIIGSGDKVERAVTSSGQEIACQIVGLSVGRVANSALAASGGLEVNKGVVVDERLATSAADVYAAGDVTEAPDASVGGRALSFGWMKAWRQGQAAGDNMAGGKAGVGDAISNLQIQIDEIDFMALGINNPPPGAGLRKESALFADVGVYKSLVRRNGTLVGATFLGNVAEAGIIERLIRSQADVTQLDPAVHKQMFDAFSLRSVVVAALCPVCKFAVPLQPGANEGDVMTCPICGVDMRLERMSNGQLGARVA